MPCLELSTFVLLNALRVRRLDQPTGRKVVTRPNVPSTPAPIEKAVADRGRRVMCNTSGMEDFASNPEQPFATPFPNMRSGQSA